MTTTMVEAHPLTARCAKIFATREHILLGVSALNGYFTVPTLTTLLGWATAQFARVDVLVPGMELAGTLMAKGYERPRARKKAREEINNTRNRVSRALEAAGATGVGVFSWTDLYGEVAYEKTRQEIGLLYESDGEFREHCHTALAEVLGAAEHAGSALPFLLAELPFMVNTPEILGTRTSLFCYPKLLPMGEWLFSGNIPSANQGILTTRLTGVVADKDDYPGVART
ncbi:MAG: tRNA-dependent cyclodipeptide synthase [Thermoactinospora sp.]|nr:tRNA-dependent cyclodipeptide synthase [Thermoactinospora sp.]